MDFHTDHPVRLRLHTPPDLVTALPSLLGFHPEDSLVLLSVGRRGGRHAQFALRTDLPPPVEAAELAHHLVGVAVARQSVEVLAVVVGGGGPPGPGDAPPRPDVVDALARRCALVGLPVRATVWAAQVAKDAPWRCYGGCGCSGLLPDPACTPLAAETVASGQVIYADRAELERMVAPGDPSVLLRRSAALDLLLEDACRSGEMPVGGAAGLALLARWMHAARTERPRLADADVVAVCLALSDPTVRDAAMGFALGGWPEAAERLWATLVAECPDPEAAEPAVLLAFSALLRGDGALANVALERAQQSWPGHRLSEMFLEGLCSGIPPGELQGWFVQGIEEATAALGGLR